MTTDERIMKAWGVVKRLQTWIEDRDGLSSVPIANFTASDRTLEIGIGPCGIWSDQADNDDELTFEFCRDRFLEEIEQFAPFMQEERAGS